MSVRLFDRVVAAVALLLLGPLLVVVGLVVRATSRGPALHRATRAGLGGDPFILLKFRSMVLDAADQGTSVTAAGDPRITSIGRFLRATKVDELPQLVNVVRGEMGLVGARPEDPRYVDLDDPLQRELYRYPPGMTGAASVVFRSEETLLAEAVERGTPHEEAYGLISREKMEIDLEYLRRRTLAADIAMIARTLLQIFRTSAPEPSSRDELDRAYRSYSGAYADSRWGAHVPGNAAIVAEREALLLEIYGASGAPISGPVLDIGSGTSASFPGVFDPGDLIRLDVLEWRLDSGQAAGCAGHPVCGDGTALPFPDHSIGVALLGTVLSSVDKETGRELLEEMARVVRPGGLGVVYDFRIPNPRNRATRSIPRRWIVREMVGFESEARSVTVIPPLVRRLGSRTDSAYPKLARLPLLRSHNLVVGRRCDS